MKVLVLLVFILAKPYRLLIVNIFKTITVLNLIVMLDFSEF